MTIRQHEQPPILKSGFTLIELIIVMAILAILMAIGTGAFISSMKKGRDSTRKANLRAITNAVEMYYNDKGEYPAGSGGSINGCYDNALSGTGTCGTAYPVFKDPITNGATYMAKFPTDPVDSQQYYYVSDKTQYQIYAHLENDQDPQCLKSNCAAVPGVSCGTEVVCNYGIASANTSP